MFIFSSYSVHIQFTFISYTIDNESRGAPNGALPLWSGELQSMPRVYREAIIDHMFIFADASKISKLVFALKDQSLDYGKE